MIADRKQRAINAILRNNLYLPESGFYQRMEERLSKCSLEFLDGLQTLIEQKVHDVTQKKVCGGSKAPPGTGWQCTREAGHEGPCACPLPPYPQE